MGLELDKLEYRMDQMRVEMVDVVLKLTRDDAPKNKFTIIAGKISMIDDVKAEIRNIREQSESKGS